MAYKYSEFTVGSKHYYLYTNYNSRIKEVKKYKKWKYLNAINNHKKYDSKVAAKADVIISKFTKN